MATERVTIMKINRDDILSHDVEQRFATARVGDAVKVVINRFGTVFDGTLAKVQFDDGHVRVNVPGYGLNKFPASDVEFIR